MSRGIALLVTGAALLVPGASSAALVPTVSVPTVSVPTVSVPAVTVPSVTTPPVGVGTVSVPSVTTPSVTTPSVNTPPLPVKAPPRPIPVRQTPTGDTPAGSQSSPSRNTTSNPQAATPLSSGAASSGRSTASSGRGAGTGPKRTSHSGAGRPTPAASGARARRTTATGSAAIRAAGAVTQRNAAAIATTTRHPANAHKSKPAGGPLVRLVKVLPAAVLIALLAFGVIAAAMALNAYLQSRRARSLAGQREALLSDVGVLQAALLPAVPDDLGELGVSVAYRPAQGLAAGGDFFDVFAISPETTGIIIGDVSGHGRESLIHAALVRYTLRTLMGEGHPLPEVLARADRYLTGELDEGYATVVICRYEHATGEFTWAKAGHEPPIIAGQPEADEPGASPLGFGLGGGWPEFSRALAPGERICLFTDGLIEARRHGDQLGRAHLRALVEQGMSAQELVEQVQSDADECPDDLAAVVITRAPAVSVVQPTGTDTRQPATV